MTTVNTSNGWGPWRIFISASSGVAATVVVALLTWWLADQTTDNFPAWLGAWATVLGVGAAIVAGFYAARAFGLEFQREERWEEQQRASQAALIAAWPGELKIGLSPVLKDSLQVQDQTLILGAHAYLRNASSVPATEVEVNFWLVLLDEASIGRDRRLLGSKRLAYLPPSSKAERVILDRSKEPHRRTEGEVDYSELRVEIHFRDAAGQVWFRDAMGQLVAAR